MRGFQSTLTSCATAHWPIKPLYYFLSLGKSLCQCRKWKEWTDGTLDLWFIWSLHRGCSLINLSINRSVASFRSHTSKQSSSDRWLARVSECRLDCRTNAQNCAVCEIRESDLHTLPVAEKSLHLCEVVQCEIDALKEEICRSKTPLAATVPSESQRKLILQTYRVMLCSIRIGNCCAVWVPSWAQQLPREDRLRLGTGWRCCTIELFNVRKPLVKCDLLVPTPGITR
jgi:hypothetical protein